MIDKKNGIVLLTVVVSILVMIMILTTIIVSANGIVENTRKKQFVRELMLIGSSVDTYIARNSGIDAFSSATPVEINTTDLASGTIDQFNSETIINNKIILYAIDLYEIDVDQVNFGNGKYGVTDRYLISISTGKIYYEKGIKLNGKIYYTLTNELKK